MEANQSLEKDYYEIRNYMIDYICIPERIEYGMMKFRHEIRFDLPKNIEPDLNDGGGFEIEIMSSDYSSRRIIKAIKYTNSNTPLL